MESWDLRWYYGINISFNSKIMALTSSEQKEIEVMIRKEIKSFMENNTIKQFEDKLLDRIGREIKRGKLEGDVKDITLRMFREFYQFMWMNRSYWEPRLKNA
jgi:hypothetical protein